MTNLVFKLNYSHCVLFVVIKRFNCCLVGTSLCSITLIENMNERKVQRLQQYRFQDVSGSIKYTSTL